jgi:hypothetical protein
MSLLVAVDSASELSQLARPPPPPPPAAAAAAFEAAALDSSPSRRLSLLLRVVRWLPREQGCLSRSSAYV